MTAAHQMEQLSRAYVQAVCALAGCTAARPDPDYGVDLTVRQLKRVGDVILPRGRNLDLQLKATTTAELTTDEVVYDLDARGYDLLRRATHAFPMLLVLLMLPAGADWLVQSEERFEIRGAAYWLSLRRAPAVANETSVRVRIPRRNLFTPGELVRILGAVQRREDA